ncbi:acyl-CoA dehydrogenase [Sorangium cellulosum]|uniref:Acyl-CoA dehydrogenase n=1 Tax=Sorangium cellulosum TaxID=56 RepID=A0A150P1A8_SORCE|nr:acyl-CoA dehydrogenase [Sorangium cellulosum]
MKIFDPTLLRLPFYDHEHRELADRLEDWVERNAALPETWRSGDVGDAVRQIAAVLGRDGWLDHAVENPRRGAPPGPDFRAICLIREALSYCDDLLDFVFSIQSLSAYAIAMYGTAEQKATYLPAIKSGSRLGSLALSEPRSGSDIAGVQLVAERAGAGFRLTGDKAWIANGNVADFHCVLARTGEGPAAFGLSFFIVPAEAPHLLATPVDLIAPRPISGLRFEGCEVPSSALLGKPGHGFRYALETLERYRVSVGATALGFCRRAMHEALAWSRARHTPGGALFDLQMTKERLADMAVYLDAASLLVARTAWEVDACKADALSRHSSITKVYATDGAQEVVDRALQMFGAAGLVSGSITERLYRQVRLLRIYEGASEVQKMIIAGSLR